MTYQGSCHCGETRFEATGTLGQVIDCNCSHCLRKGYLLWFIPRSDLAVHSTTPLSTYTFNKHQIQHMFCPRCGCAPFGLGTNNGVEMAAINVRCLEDVDPGDLEIQKVDGRSF